jgi:threonine aldolase
MDRKFLLWSTERDGTLAISSIKNAIQSPDIHCAVTKLICLENTHNVCGGVPLSKAYTDEVILPVLF